MENKASSRKTSKEPLDRINGRVSSDQENSIDDSSTLTSEASTSDTLPNGGARITSRSGAAERSQANNWSKTACFSGDDSLFFSIVLSLGVAEAYDTFRQANWEGRHEL